MAKVLVIAKWYPNDNDLVHGIYVKEFVKAKKLYNDVIVVHSELTSVKSPKFPYEIYDILEDDIRTIRFIYKRRFLKLHRITNFIAWFHCLSKLSKENYKPDIIHFHEYDASLPVFLYAKLHKIPLVITEHYTGFVKNTLTFSQQVLAKTVLRRSNAIFPVSKYLKKHILKYAPKARFEVVNNVVDTSLFKSSLPIRKGNSEKKLMLIVARLEPNKGISYLINALDILKKTRDDFFLEVIGDGSLRKELEDMKNRLELNDFVRFHGALPKPKVAEYMSKCDFFVLPSLFETFGCVLIEAMSCGKPVLATNIGGPDEIITQQTGILVEPANSEALKDGIDFMLDNYFSYSADDIVNYVKNHFSFEAIGLKLNQLYNDIIAKK
jgi:glycosyltransferase involved in cell wall biosynthesis